MNNTENIQRQQNIDIDTDLDNDINFEENMDDEWITSFEKYQSFYKDNVNYIIGIFYYINQNNEITHIHKRNIELNNSILSQTKLVFLLKKLSLYSNTYYSLLHILKINPNYEIHQILNNKTDLSNIKLEEIKSINDIFWDDCIEFFNDLNQIHIFYREKLHKNLKKNHNNTKKIFINNNVKKHKTNKNKTIRRY